MQTVRTYDTHQAIKKFISLGFSEEQSEGMVEESIKLFEKAQGDLATKSDIQAVRAEIQAVKAELKSEIQEVKAALKSEIQSVRAELKEVEMRLENKIEKEIGSVKYDILKWMIPMFLAIFIKLFF